MHKGEFSVRPARWEEDHEALFRIREAVFVNEQGVPRELELDGRDATALHLLAEDEEGRPVGTARLLADGHIGRMAVIAPWRGRGVGSTLLRELLRHAAQIPGIHPWLDAQHGAIGFYRHLGFTPVGPGFTAAGIPHRRMRPVRWP